MKNTRVQIFTDGSMAITISKEEIRAILDLLQYMRIALSVDQHKKDPTA